MRVNISSNIAQRIVWTLDSEYWSNSPISPPLVTWHEAWAKRSIIRGSCGESLLRTRVGRRKMNRLAAILGFQHEMDNKSGEKSPG